MPVDRVPVVHKFGIISHTQRVALESRLAKKSLGTNPPLTFSRTRRTPYEVTEDFIAKFNDSNEEDRTELEEVAFKMISRAKRRAGILVGGEGNHVNLGKSWTELGLLAQCTSRLIQEESLELLITSLGQAPPSVDQLPSLIYLAKSCLYWLRKFAKSPTCLRTAELKLIKMGHLAFSRLFYHNMTQDLKGFQDEKKSMIKYLTVLPDEHEEAYKCFPGILMAVRYMKEVGQLICTGCGEPNQEDSAILELPSEIVADKEPESTVQEKSGQPATGATEGGRMGLPLLIEEEEEEEEEAGHNSGDLGNKERNSLSLPHSPAPTSSIHDLSPTLWHSLDVWRSVMHRGTGLRQALEGLSMCGTDLKSELWLDVCCAFQVLTEVSKQDIAVLRTFQALAAGIFSRPAGMSDTHARHVHICNNCLSNMTDHHSFNPKDFSEDDLGSNGTKTKATSLGETPSFVRRLRGFAGLEINDKRVGQLEDDAASVRLRDTGSDGSSEANFADVSSVESGCGGREGRATVTSNSVKKTRRTVARNGETFSDSEDEKDEAHKMDDFTENIFGPLKERDGTGVRFNVEEPIVGNSEGAVSKANMTRAGTKDSLNSGHTRASSVTIPLADEDETTSIKTETSQFSNATGLTGWRWELAYLYTDCMTSLCMSGQTSAIQKTALLGSEAKRRVAIFSEGNTTSKEGLGLLDLLKIKFPIEEGKAQKDWSWRIRFAAVQGLVRICRQCGGDKTKDGMCGVAWNQLMRHHSSERDVRVLEAWKLAQVDSQLDSKWPPLDVANAFPSWAAGKLSAALLPPLPPVVALKSRSRPRPHAMPISKAIPVTKKGPKRPSLRQEILLATAAREPQPDYRSRRNHELMLVIEDQWRKQLHEEEEENELYRREKEATRIEGFVVKEAVHKNTPESKTEQTKRKDDLGRLSQARMKDSSTSGVGEQESRR